MTSHHLLAWQPYRDAAKTRNPAAGEAMNVLDQHFLPTETHVKLEDVFSHGIDPLPRGPLPPTEPEEKDGNREARHLQDKYHDNNSAICVKLVLPPTTTLLLIAVSVVVEIIIGVVVHNSHRCQSNNCSHPCL